MAMLVSGRVVKLDHCPRDQGIFIYKYKSPPSKPSLLQLVLLGI